MQNFAFQTFCIYLLGMQFGLRGREGGGVLQLDEVRHVKSQFWVQFR